MRYSRNQQKSYAVRNVIFNRSIKGLENVINQHFKKKLSMIYNSTDKILSVWADTVSRNVQERSIELWCKYDYI